MPRVSGEGKIAKHHSGLYRWRVTLPNGERVDYYGATQKEVRDKRKEALRALEDGLPVIRGKHTLARFVVEEFLPSVKRTREHSTYDYNKKYWRLHIEPTLGHLELKAIEPRHLDELYEAKAEALNGTSRLHLHNIIHRMLRVAMRRGYVYRNVVDMVDAPTASDFEGSPLPLDAIFRVLDGARREALGGMVIDALLFAKRRGEVLGQHWADIRDGSVFIRRNVTPAEGLGLVEGKPKTRRSVRDIPVIGLADELFARQRSAQAKQRLRAGERWEDQDLVWTCRTGGPIQPTTLYRVWNRIRKAAGVSVRFHDLRHSTATLLRALDVPEDVIADIIGHAELGMTRHYVKINDAQKRVAMEKLQAALGSRVALG